MEEIDGLPRLFNSPLEAGLRLVVVLEQLHPRNCGLTELTWFDYLAVHSGSAGGPASLHPDSPASAGELVVRRSVVEHGVQLMQRVHLIEEIHTDDGICFSASEDSPSFVAALQSPYFEALKARGAWIAERFGDLSAPMIQKLMRERVGEWSAQFMSPAQTSSFR